LHEQLAEQAQLEMVKVAEQEAARLLIAEVSQKLSTAVQEQQTICMVQRLHHAVVRATRSLMPVLSSWLTSTMRKTKLKRS